MLQDCEQLQFYNNYYEQLLRLLQDPSLVTLSLKIIIVQKFSSFSNEIYSRINQKYHKADLPLAVFIKLLAS